MSRSAIGDDLTLLGFDFGEKRIGVAVGQTVTASAQGVATVSVRQGKVDWSAIDRIFADWKPQCCIVGLPGAADDDSPLIRKIHAFKSALTNRYHVPVDYIDERLTSAEADHRIRLGAAHGKSQSKRIAQRDSVAAELIVETWLNRHADPSP